MIKADAVEILTRYRNLLWPEIESYLNSIKNFPGFSKINPKYQSLLDYHFKIVSDYPKRKGKYLRPTLTLLTAQAMGFDLKKSFPTASAMQLSEEWLLDHDDIEDKSLYRRGQPTLHQIYGVDLAINAGDALHLLMWEVLSKNFSILDIKTTENIYKEFFMMLNRTVFGQGTEIKWATENRFDLTEEDNFLILESKTGYYTIAGPMRLGAILAGASDQQLESIYKFGVLLGRSFQIIDDLLDLTSDFKGLKKEKGNDVYEGKKTIILLHLLKNASPKDLLKLKEILLKTGDKKSPEEVLWIIKKMEEYKSFDYSRQLAQKFANEAQKIFNHNMKFIIKEPFRSELESIFNFIVTRDH